MTVSITTIMEQNTILNTYTKPAAWNLQAYSNLLEETLGWTIQQLKNSLYLVDTYGDRVCIYETLDELITDTQDEVTGVVLALCDE